VTFNAPGTYRLRLTASNPLGSRSDETTVTVRPAPPGPASTDGYFVLEQDGDLYAFGDARPLLRAMDPSAVENPSRQTTISSALKPFVAGTGAVAVERTADGKGLWVLLSDGRIGTLGTAPPVPGVPAFLLTKVVAGVPEHVTALTRVGTGDLWVFTSAGRIIPQIGTLPAGVVTQMDTVLALNLLGPIVDAKPTVDGSGALAMATDGGIFAYAAPFLGSVYDAIAEALGVPVGAIGPDRPVVGITMDPDGDGYWVVAEDGGVFTPRSRASFRGSLPAIIPFERLFAPVNGMVPFGNGYLLGAGDGGVFNFSNKPFSGSASGLLDTPAVGMTPL
jgi:hypothetical protein